MGYYPYRAPLKPEELTITGLKRRLRKLELRMQDLPAEEDERSMDERVERGDRVTIDDLLNAIKQLRATIPLIDAQRLEAEPLSFALPSIADDALFIPPYYGPHAIQHVFDNIERLVKETQVTRRARERSWIYRKLLPRTHANDLESLSTKELNYARLSSYRAVLNETANAIARGQKCRWPDIINLRVLLAKREGEKDALRRSRIFAPVPPSAHDILRARVAAADQQARDAMSALRGKIPRTEVCPYCNLRVAEKGYHLDHIVPVARGGISAEDNLVYVCVPCNQKKRSLGLTVFAKQEGIAVEPLIERLHRLGKHV
jgi:5-methylcytosine-specific restriction endonuclease McrA